MKICIGLKWYAKKGGLRKLTYKFFDNKVLNGLLRE